jgi:hypothetical protein
MRLKHRATALACCATLAILAGCAGTPAAIAPAAVAPAVPQTLAVPPDQVLSRVLEASGVQIYECKTAHDDPTRMEWAFKAPEAQLRDTSGQVIGKHYAGPTWEAGDGSKVVGEVTGRQDAPDRDAIPWLLLRAKSTVGQGLFSRTTSIQRLRTSGGKAPTSGCDPASAGREARVPYEAQYLFYVARP